MKPKDRLIQQPPRSSVTGAVLILITVVLLSIIPFSLRISPWAITLALLLVIAAALVREAQALHLALFTALLTAGPLLHPALRNWPFNLLVPIIVYLVLALSVPRLRTSLQWLRAGRFGKDIVLLSGATAMISGIALSLWYWLLRPDLSVHLGYMPAMPVSLLPFAGLGFSIGNAAMEEFVFRGVVMQTTDSAFSPGWLSIIIQAWLFGSMHYLRGFPNGAWGLAMTIVYGIMLGSIRRRSQGMLAPLLVHVAADVVIFAILASLVLSG